MGANRVRQMLVLCGTRTDVCLQRDPRMLTLTRYKAAPPPEPKAYTDEELQQRYGIHLATRIQKDDGGKQANWADIDDDDDDWAPDSMEWADGTKVTLPQPEEPIPEPPAPVPAPVLPEPVSLEPPKSNSPAPTSTATPPPVKSGGLGSGRTGLVLMKGQTEKPTLVAKPPGPPAQMKSPWAQLPPVEKIAPVAIELPTHQPPQSRFGRSDPHGFQGMPPPPAKEIAADDFSRTWRDGNSNTNRELYDSKSGRYEPVNDTRRGSRNDARHPSLLQRPHQSDGPAEPSAAFQTHRATGEQGYGRRRTSSNVSGGSGNLMRRMSRGQDMPPPHELLGPRRGSLAAVSDDPASPGFSQPSQLQGPRSHQGQPWQRSSPAVSHGSPQITPGQPIPLPIEAHTSPATPYEDPIEEQKKIMRASRELAIKRRQEAEAKEESEKKERLRLKLEALGPAPEKKSKKDAPKEETSNPVPVQIQARSQSGVAGNSSESVEGLNEVEPHSESQEKFATSKPQEMVAENRANGAHELPSPQPPQKSLPDGQPIQNWQNQPSSSDRFQGSWPQQQTQQASRNVWGPPTNDRSLGNGTFDQELGSLPDMAPAHPGPIGPPGRGNGYQQRGSRDQNSARPGPIGPPNRQSYRPTPDPRVATSGWANATQIIREDDRRHYEENAKAAALRREQEALGLAKPYEPPPIEETWRQVIVGKDGSRSKVVASHTTIHGLHEDDKPLVLPKAEDTTTRPIFEERAEDSQRHFDAIGTQPRQSDRTAPSRSRFFPSQDVRLEQRHTEEYTVPFERPGSPLPPPPTMPGHPVYGDNAFPQVHLPKPAPVVKLPPAVLAPIGPPRPISFAAAVATPVAIPLQQNRSAVSHDVRRQDAAATIGWQDRINSLMGRKPASPPRSHALQVDSFSKSALELPAARFTATVSLPGSVVGDLSTDNHSVVSKPAAEECFEEQEMGSLPLVKVPAAAPPAAWNLASIPKSFSRNLTQHDIASVALDALRFVSNPHIVNNAIPVLVKLPGYIEGKTFSMAVPQQTHHNRRSGGGRGGSRNNSSRGSRGGRDPSSGFSSPTVPDNGRGFNKERKSSGWSRPQPANR